LQTTLLGLAIAIILALLTALVGPLLIDWASHRSVFEAEASRLLGLQVRVNGEIEARLLPAPRLTLHEIEIGSGGEQKVRARALGFEFALGSLMRGEWRAAEMQLVGPQLRLGLDPAGHVVAPNLAIQFSPDSLSIDHLSVEDGKVTLTDAASGGSATFERLWFNGEARSLLGPFKGEGAATVSGELYPFRLAISRYSEESSLRLHVNVDPVSRPLSIETDGTLTLAGGAPKFDGSLSFSRPVGIASRATAEVTQPWRIGGKVKASTASALMQQFEFQYGSEEQGVKLTGVAEFKFGRQPRFDGVLSGRQVDLDRALARDDGVRSPPAAAIRQIAELAADAFRPAIPIQISIGINQVTLGGSTVANLRGDITTDANGWNLDRFEFRAPGFTQVRLSGHLAVGAGGVSFTGPAEIDAGDPKVLAAWLEGRSNVAGGNLRPLNLRGDVVLGSERIAIERLRASVQRRNVSGRLAYVFAAGNRPASLDAALDAPELDIDAALGFGKALLTGSNLTWPPEMAIVANIGRATFAGFEARETSAKLQMSGSGLQIDRLSVADLGGGSFSASGHIDTDGGAPRGALTFDFESRQTAAVTALVERFAPATAREITGLLARVNRAKLHGSLDITDDKQASATVAQATLTGTVDTMNLNLKARASGRWEKAAAADIRVDGAITAPEGAMLLKLFALDRYVTAVKGAGELKVLVSGRADAEQKIDLRLACGGLVMQSSGQGHISLDKGLQLTSMLDISGADLAPLRPGAKGSLPATLKARLLLGNRSIKLENLNAQLGGSNVRGTIAFEAESPRVVSGALEADAVDAGPLIAAAAAMPTPASGSVGWVWSSDPFGAGPFGDYAGQVAIKARRLDLMPRLTAREFRGSLRFGKQQLALEDASAEAAGGRLAGQLSLASGEEGLKAKAKISLKGVDAASVFAADARPAVTGSLDFAAELEGSGLSAVALIGSLHGSGRFTLNGAQLAGLDPRVFDAVTRAVDKGLAIDSARISDTVSKSLDSGRLSIERMEGTIAISAGQMRLSPVTAESKDAAVSMAGSLDLTEGTLDGRLILSGSARAAGARPDIFMAVRGPVAAPARTINVAALTGWLTLRAVENQSKQLRDMENARRWAPPPKNEPKSKAVPALPAPIDVRPLPVPGRSSLPEALVRP
jgi:uncharacterized protein involved in outer membrane biogenesis